MQRVKTLPEEAIPGYIPLERMRQELKVALQKILGYELVDGIHKVYWEGRTNNAYFIETRILSGTLVEVLMIPGRDIHIR